jgi:glycosyltransferase involved in cell wall biosynthesis
MRILLAMDPLIPVPPRHYGGIERVIADLAAGLVARGHEVTLWAAPSSSTPARLEPFGREGEWTRFSNVRNTLHLAARFWLRPGRFDVVHNFGRLAYLTPIASWRIAKVQTYMRRIDPAKIRGAVRLAGRRGGPTLRFTAVSDVIRKTGEPGGGDWSVIYNCAPVARYSPRYDVDAATAPLVFLGRLERCKGAHSALDVAERLDRPLLIAGNLSDLPEEKAYFETEIAPRIDGQRVRFLGPVDDAEKNQLLGSAAALLLPIEWLEPFPVVLPEALACATPVVAFRQGGVPEGIDHGRTGFLCDTVDEMAALVRRLPEIDRHTCRAEAERRFSDTAIVGEYEALYRELLEKLPARI